MFSALAVSAVVPLITDDADPVAPGHLQLNSGLSFSRMASANFYDYSVNPVYGITSRGEFGVTFGYRSQNDAGNDFNGISDVILETKWRLLGTDTNQFKLSARCDLKLPAASERLALGTGQPDADLILIATRDWGDTSLDWNIGYTVIDAAHGNFGDDRWFFGQAVRQQLNDRWTLLGDVYLTFSQGRSGAPANFNFEGGPQFSLRENIQLSLLVGSSIGRDTPDLTGYLGFSWTF